MNTKVSSERKTLRLRDLITPQSFAKRTKTLRSTDDVSFLPMEAIGEKGELDLSNVRKKKDVETGYTLFFENDVLIAKITPCFENGKGAVAAGLINGFGYGTTELHVLNPKPYVDSRFLYYVTVSHPFRKLGEANMTGAAGQKRVPTEYIYNFQVNLPPPSEQRQIAIYLDRETSKLDALIAAKKRLLELLAEKRRSLITQAVTRGLKADVPMRASGVEWLGKIPSHWETPPIYARYELLLGKMLDEKKITGKNLAPYLRNVDVQWHMINTKDLPEMDFDEMDRQNYSLKPGDILICEGGESGRTAIWEGKLQQCFYQKALHRLRPISPQEDNPIFFSFMMEAAVGSGVFTAEGNRSTIQHLTAEKLRIFRFPAPPFSEQAQIVEYIQSKLRTLDSLCSVAERIITLLQERRTSLISAAVTGQLQIPN